MSDQKKSIYDGLKYLYAEQLKGHRVAMTIKAITAEMIVGDGGKKTQGFCVSFNERPKMLIIAGSTIRRQLAQVTGTENPDEMAGKKILLYPVPSAKSQTGLAIRIGKVE